MKSIALKDCFWLWGHDAGCHHTPAAAAAWKIPGVNRMDSLEGARYLGIPNCCRVVFHGNPVPPFDAESEKLREFDHVVWSIVDDGGSTRNDKGHDDLEEVLRQAALHPNVTGGVLDDFFRPATGDARMTLARMIEVRDRLHEAQLKLWLVYYAALLGIDYRRYLEVSDVITFWSWTSAELARAEENLARLITMTPGKKHYAGCYLYNYGDCRPIAPEEMQFQLALYRKLLHAGRIWGVIVCSNTVADVGLAAPEYLRNWLLKHGDEEVAVAQD